MTDTTTAAWRGITLDVLRHASGQDCTLGGITSQHTELTLVGVIDARVHRSDRPEVVPLPKACQVGPETPERPAVALLVREIGGSTSLALTPVRWGPFSQAYATDGRWYMAGGNYAAVGDGRVDELLHRLTGSRFVGALSVHDRHEG